MPVGGGQGGVGVGAGSRVFLESKALTIVSFCGWSMAGARN